MSAAYVTRLKKRLGFEVIHVVGRNGAEPWVCIAATDATRPATASEALLWSECLRLHRELSRTTQNIKRLERQRRSA